MLAEEHLKSVPGDKILWISFSFSIAFSPENQARKEVILNAKRSKTTDIFKGAFFLCNGETLSEVKLRDEAEITSPDLLGDRTRSTPS